MDSLRMWFEANDGVVLLINGTAKVDVIENCFSKNGRTQVIEFQCAVGKPVKAKIVAKRQDETNQLTHKLSYISGRDGEEWANLDEKNAMIRNQSGNTDLPYTLKEPMRFGQDHDGEGGQLKGVNLKKGTKRSVIAIQDSACATVKRNRLKCNDGYGILISGSAAATLEENVLEDCQNTGICIEGTSQSMVKGNTVRSSKSIGVQVLDSACPTLEGNQICVSSKSAAIRCMGKSGGRIQKNLLKSWERKHALVIGEEASPKVEENDIAGTKPEKTDSCVVNQPEKKRKSEGNFKILNVQDLDVLPLSRAAKTPGQRGEPPVTDVALKTPTKSFSQIKVLLKLRWLLRLHSACCELDYKMCSLRNIILGMQYVVLQECAEVACDSIFDTKVQQNVGAHLNLESVLDDIADQLYRSLGKAHKAFLEYVASCDPTRSVHFSQIDSPLTPPQVQSNEQLATALDTIFITNFLRQSQRESSCTLREFLDDLEALNLQAPEIPPLNGAQYLRAWALAKTKPSPESRQKGLGEDMVKLAQLDAVLLCAAIELHSPEVQASENELQDRRLIVNVPENPSSAVGGAPEPINFGSTGRKPGVSPTNAKIMYVERPQLSPAIIDAVIHVIQHHFTFPEGIRLRLHRLLFDEYGLTTEQAQNVEIAATTNIDGKRLTEDVLWSIDQKEKARLRKYFVDTGKDTSHLLAPSLVPSPWMQGKLAKFPRSAGGGVIWNVLQSCNCSVIGVFF
eukprot:symbB.v1.2.000241.t2/scaffold4.1/size633627/23